MKILKGSVISDKMAKSAVVVVERKWSHPLYKKTVLRSKKYLVDNARGARLGDLVTIVECRPMSKNKRWEIKSIDKKAPQK